VVWKVRSFSFVSISIRAVSAFSHAAWAFFHAAMAR
jgi:hypothetical protein